jgi:hypothetical protein
MTYHRPVIVDYPEAVFIFDMFLKFHLVRISSRELTERASAITGVTMSSVRGSRRPVTPWVLFLSGEIPAAKVAWLLKATIAFSLSPEALKLSVTPA